jgi:tetratricopeptide (TPR) repeat protein
MVLGEGLHARGEHAEAEELLAAVLEQTESLFGERHRNTIHAHQVLALVLAALGRVGEAEGLARRAVELCLEHHPEQIDGEIRARWCLAAVFAASGDVEGRRAELEAARQRLRGDTRHPAWWATSWTLAETELADGRGEDAAAEARELIAIQEAAVPVEVQKVAMARGLLGRALWAQGLGDAAGPELAACFEVTSRWTDLQLAVLSDESLDSLIEVSLLLGQAQELERLRRLRTEGLLR